ncbi:MAG: hypothetical protein CM1200mP39_20460 [Dehalococcoidia bacterium]|nr:MAG: hypothetical protein CM1200mP39_20460 [Dehalococcoidia bacterium]
MLPLTVKQWKASGLTAHSALGRSQLRLSGNSPVSFCATCHEVIGVPGNSEINILRDAAGIIGDDGKEPINWRRVHRLPDHVRFVHEPHIRYLTQNPSEVKGIQMVSARGLLLFV